MTTPRRTNQTMRRLGVALLAGSLFVAACSDDGDTTTEADTEAPAETTEAPEDTESTESTDDEMADDEAMSEDDEMADDEMAEDDEMADDEMAEDDEMSDDEMADGDMLGATGPACDAVPTEGEGSFNGMADDPAATAASNNPLLSTLVGAVDQAGLVDTLNSDGPFTIFAPTNDAFAAVPSADLEAVLADEELLTSVLTYHVVAGEQLSAADLVDAGTVTTVNGAELTIEAAGDVISVNGVAMTLCQDVPTANATVHIIDAVLLP